MNERIDVIKKALHNLLLEMNTVPPGEEFADDPELAEAFEVLYDIRSAFEAMSRGELDFTVSGKGHFTGIVKSFQAALRHLTWQAKAVAEGDFTQRVDFLGELADSFNQMTEALSHAVRQLQKSEGEYRQLFENAAEAIVLVQDAKIMLSNPMFLVLTGYTEDELKKMDFLDVFHPDDHDMLVPYSSENQPDKKMQPAIRIIKKSGEIGWVESKGIEILWSESGACLYFLNDISIRKKALDYLYKSEEKFRMLAENSSDMIWIYNLTRKEIVYLSPSSYYLLGYKAEDAAKLNLRDVISDTTYDQTKKTLLESVKKFSKNPEKHHSLVIEIMQKNSKGKYIWTESSVNFRYNSAGEIELIGSSRSIDNRKKAQEEVAYLSYHDQLTGLYNRRFFDEEFVRMDRDENLPITVVMADVNGLKLTNDAFGHGAGDVLLKTFSNILKQYFRPEDVLARIGGDEFVMLLKNTGTARAEEIIADIKKVLDTRRSDEIILSASFGLHTKTNIHEHMDRVYRNAETNMYHNKLVESKEMKSKTILLIQSRLNKKSEHIKRHSENVSRYCGAIGTVMGMDKDAVDELRLLGLLHDIGKISVSDYILNKKEPLTDAETAKMQRHAEIGYQILRSVSIYANLADYVLCHHEFMDGSGYPRQLKGHEIPLQSKIVSVAEAYDAMTTWQPGREIMVHNEACEQLLRGAGKQFDEEIVDVFVQNVLGGLE